MPARPSPAPDALIIERVRAALPEGLDALRREALGEGHGMLDRLAAEWETGMTRFDRPGEALFAARWNGELAGIGGLTIDPAIPMALRMRRFYVARACRGHGVGRALADAAMRAAAATGGLVTVHAGSAAASRFWQGLGFRPDPREGISHSIMASG